VRSETERVGNTTKLAEEGLFVKPDERKRPVLIGGVILIVLIVAGLSYGVYWFINRDYISTDDASIDSEHVNVSSKMLGRIKNLLVAEGDKVEVGQLLVQLDDADLRAQKAQATASLNYARQNLILAKVNLDKAQDDFKRARSLFNTGAATKEQYDHALKALDSADAGYSIAQAQIDAADAQLGVIEAQLLNTRIAAPISGVIAKQSAMPGDVVQPGQAIFLINDLDNVWVIANFEETKFRMIHLDVPAEISVDAYPNHQFKGRVVRLGAGIVAPPFSIGEFTKTTQKIPIKISFDHIPDSMLILPGMSVEVKIKVR
jgi:membrane fusion protein (multidrug efflux system)